MALSNKTNPVESDISPGHNPPEETTSRKRLPWGWIIIGVALIAGLVAWNRARARGQAAASAQASGNAAAVSVGVSPVLKRDVPYFLTGLGSVTAFNTATVS